MAEIISEIVAAIVGSVFEVAITTAIASNNPQFLPSNNTNSNSGASTSTFSSFNSRHSRFTTKPVKIAKQAKEYDKNNSLNLKSNKTVQLNMQVSCCSINTLGHLLLGSANEICLFGENLSFKQAFFRDSEPWRLCSHSIAWFNNVSDFVVVDKENQSVTFVNISEYPVKVLTKSFVDENFDFYPNIIPNILPNKVWVTNSGLILLTDILLPVIYVLDDSLNVVRTLKCDQVNEGLGDVMTTGIEETITVADFGEQGSLIQIDFYGRFKKKSEPLRFVQSVCEMEKFILALVSTTDSAAALLMFNKNELAKHAKLIPKSEFCIYGIEFVMYSSHLKQMLVINNRGTVNIVDVLIK